MSRMSLAVQNGAVDYHQKDSPLREVVWGEGVEKLGMTYTERRCGEAQRAKKVGWQQKLM